VAAVLPTWLVVPWPVTSSAARLSAPLSLHQCFLLFLAGMVFTFVYSAPGSAAPRPKPSSPT
jgi:hypothetical protein